mgnify:CR=1 FL=1
MDKIKKILGSYFKITAFLIFTIIWSIFIYLIQGEWLYFIPLVLADVIFFETIPWFFWKKKKKKEKIQKEDPKIVRIAHTILAIVLATIACSIVFLIGSGFTVIIIACVFIYLIKAILKNYNEVKSWNNAILFAIIAASILRTFLIEAYTIPTSSMEKSMLVGDFLFVSKVAYGPRVPMTPLAIPLVHHSIPGTKKKSYSEKIKLPYHRMKGTNTIKRNDCVVFNWPAEREGRPIDKKENYVKRCVALPGDKIKIENGILFVNNNPEDAYEGKKKQRRYLVKTKNGLDKRKLYEDYDIYPVDVGLTRSRGIYWLYTTEKNISILESKPFIDSIWAMGGSKDIFDNKTMNPDYFLVHNPYNWDEENYGPISIPKKGETITITEENLPIFKQIIKRYEGEEMGDSENFNRIMKEIQKNGSTQYTFKMNYYWMMGDNRQNSADSRFWGFVPENHIVGKALFTWMSWDKYKEGWPKIRWNRLFRSVK